MHRSELTGELWVLVDWESGEVIRDSLCAGNPVLMFTSREDAMWMSNCIEENSGRDTLVELFQEKA